MNDPCHALPEFVAGRLEDAERDEFVHHLAACPGCGAAYREETLFDAKVIEVETHRAAKRGARREGGTEGGPEGRPDGGTDDALNADWLALLVSLPGRSGVVIPLPLRSTPPPEPLDPVGHPAPPTDLPPADLPPAAPPESTPPLRAPDQSSRPDLPDSVTPIWARARAGLYRHGGRAAAILLPAAAGLVIGAGIGPGGQGANGGSAHTAQIVAQMVRSTPERPFEGRLTLALADVHREFRGEEVMRGSLASPLGRAAVSAMEGPLRSGEVMRGEALLPVTPGPLALPPMPPAPSPDDQPWQLRGAAWMLAGNLPEAERMFGRALVQSPASPSVQSDLAALAIWRGQPEQALVLADSALATASETGVKLPQARWNRALALRDLGLPLLAARTYREVAAAAEQGRSREALRHAELLEAPLRQRRQAFRGVWEAGGNMARRAAAPLGSEEARSHPGLARLFLYDALRLAPSRDRVLALLPLAHALDLESLGAVSPGPSPEGRVPEGRVLERRVMVLAGADFALRGGLVARYHEMVPEKRSPTWDNRYDAFVAELRRAGQDDLLLGALFFDDPRLRGEGRRRSVEEYRRLADRSGDPWFGHIATIKEARADLADGQLDSARTRLLSALDACHANGLENRCNKIEIELADLFQGHGSPVEARRMALQGLEHAREAREWSNEQRFLMQLAGIERERQALSLAAAWVGEARERVLDDQAVADFAGAQREVGAFADLEQALADLESLRIAPAREALARYASATGKPPRQDAVLALAELQHWGTSAAEQQRVRRALAALREAPDATRGLGLVAAASEGRAWMEADAAAGKQQLEAALKQVTAYRVELASREPVMDDVGGAVRRDPQAERARWMALAGLASEAGRAREWTEAFALLASGLDAPPPAPCSLGVMLDYDRLLVVVRDRAGRDEGRYDPHRSPPFLVEELVPPESLRALADCETIDVYAAPPLQGNARLLPAELAWRHRVGTLGTPKTAGAVANRQPSLADHRPLPERRVLVTGARPPAWLELPPLSPRTAGLTEAPATGAGRLPGPLVVVLEGASATPSRVLLELGTASEIELHVHGLVDPALSDAALLVLSPEGGSGSGRYALTAGQIRQRTLEGHPLVILAACHAGALSTSRHRSWGLPMAFLEAGARAVLATASPLSDHDAAPFFEAVRAGAQAGRPLAVALRDARAMAQGRRWHPSVRDVVLFE